MKKYYEENKNIYKTIQVTRRISFLLLKEQGELGLTQKQMAQRLDMPLQTYKRLSSPKNTSNITMENLAKIFENSSISPSDVFGGIYN